jgi:hypothetical protein
MLIDLHAHYSPRQYVEAMARAGSERPPGWSKLPHTDSAADVGARLEAMDGAGVQLQVLSHGIMAPYLPTEADAVAAARASVAEDGDEKRDRGWGNTRDTRPPAAARVRDAISTRLGSRPDQLRARWRWPAPLAVRPADSSQAPDPLPRLPRRAPDTAQEAETSRPGGRVREPAGLGKGRRAGRSRARRGPGRAYQHKGSEETYLVSVVRPPTLW